MPASLEAAATSPQSAGVAEVVLEANKPAPLFARQADPRELERLQYLGRMVSAVSHELSNRLTSVVGYADLMSFQGNPDGMQRLAGKLREQTENLRMFAEGISGFSRSPQGRAMPFNLAAALQQVIELARCESKFRGIPLGLQAGDPGFIASVWPSEFRLALFSCLYELTRWFALQVQGEARTIKVSMLRAEDAVAEVCIKLERTGPAAETPAWPVLPDLAMALEIFADQHVLSSWQTAGGTSLSLSLRVPAAKGAEVVREGVGV